MIQKKTSKELLAESALELISKNSIDKISVLDIAKNCNVSTRTFYNHFHDKYDLLAWSYIHMLEQYYDENVDTLNFHSWLSFTARVVWEYCDFFVNAAEYYGQNDLRISLIEPLRNLYLRLLRDIYHEKITDEIYDSITFFLYGSIGFVDHTLRSGNIPRPEVSVAFFENCLPSGLKKYVQTDSY